MLADFDINLPQYYKDVKDSDTPEKDTLSQGHREWIRVLIAYIKYLDFDMENQLEEIDIDIFNEYRFKIYNPNGESSEILIQIPNQIAKQISMTVIIFRKEQREINLNI